MFLVLKINLNNTNIDLKIYFHNFKSNHMPIRFDSGEDDNNNNNNFSNNDDSNQSSGGMNRRNQGKLAIIGVILFFLFKNPKWAIPLLIIAGLIYYFFFMGEQTFVESPH